MLRLCYAFILPGESVDLENHSGMKEELYESQ